MSATRTWYLSAICPKVSLADSVVFFNAVVNDRIEIDAVFVSVDFFFFLGEQTGIVVGQAEDVFPLGAGDDIVHVLRIDLADIFYRDAYVVGNLFEMQVFVDLERIYMDGHLYFLRNDSIIFVIVDQIQCGNKGRDIPAGLARQVGVNGPEVFGSGPADGLVYIARTAVVRGDG